MALTLLNHLLWKLPEAKFPFMFADAVIVIAMFFIDKGVTAEKKLRELEEKVAEQNREMDKDEKLAQKAKQQREGAQRKQKNRYNSNGKMNGGKSGGGGKNKNNNFNIGNKKD